MRHAECYCKDYPRPQFVRKDWQSLNCEWQFAFDDEDVGENKKWYKNFPASKIITVPFSYQTEKSGICDSAYHRVMWYARRCKLPRTASKKVLINFEGVDSNAKIWCNGVFVGEHVGGYCRFSVDVTNALTGGEALIVVRVEDDLSCTKPRGKQSWLNGNDKFGCWYPSTSGIWKSVWAETVSKTSLKRVKMTPVEDTYHTVFEYEVEGFRAGLTLKTTVKFEGKLIAEQTQKLVRANSTFSIDLTDDYDNCFKIHWWTPDCPSIYDVEFVLSDEKGELDRVGSYTAFRIFKTDGNKLMLNASPAYLRLVLEQAYWRESGLTCPDEGALVKEIELCKRCGFNGIRMHQKVEDERFFYYADIMGAMMFCEMPSFYEFKDSSVQRVATEWMEIVKQHYNHPSAVVWVPVNESWGVGRIASNKHEAHFTQALYQITKAYDTMRPVISNDGWEHTSSDIVTFHNYSQDPAKLADFYSDLQCVLSGGNRGEYSNICRPFVNGFGYEGQPILIDEFAGIGFEKGSDKGWGYGNKVGSEEEFLTRLEGLVDVINSIKQIAGFCVTQLTDVYQEINGLYDFDRTCKVDEERINKIIRHVKN